MLREIGKRDLSVEEEFLQAHHKGSRARCRAMPSKSFLRKREKDTCWAWYSGNFIPDERYRRKG
jgi:hypothetical protein